MKYFLTVSVICQLLFSCSRNGRNSESDTQTKLEHSVEQNFVDTIVLRSGFFAKEILSNGRLHAKQKGELRFPLSGEIAQIFVANGQRVAKGDLIASLNPLEAQLRLVQARQRMDRAEIDLIDVLIGLGFGSDTTHAPKDALRLAQIRSGYASSKSDLELAQLNLNNMELRAPFAGKIANLNNKAYERASDPFCLLIDDSAFEVDFNILESEYDYVKKGQHVNVYPYNSPKSLYSGVITRINPLVDDRGQINIRAEVSNPEGRLIEGQHVKAVVREPVPDKLVVPKNAVVIRDNLNVLFRYNPATGKAVWTYVNIVDSNSESHIVEANTERGAALNAGDIIIVNGHLNLADGSNVIIR